MRRSLKKAVAVLLAATMVLGTSFAVLAEDVSEGSSTGTGNIEGIVNKDVFQVDLPTNPAGDPFDFIMDPQGLIEATSNAAYSGATFEDGANVYFLSSANTYTSTSQLVTILNKSSISVDVTINATISERTGVTMTDDKTFADDTNTSLYLALTGGTVSGGAVNMTDVTTGSAIVSGSAITKAIDNSTSKAVITTTMAPVDEEFFNVTHKIVSGESVYAYELNTSAPGFTAPAYTFKMEGKCNEAADWSALKDIAPSVAVTWKVVPHSTDKAPYITDASTTYEVAAAANVDVNINMGAGSLEAASIASVTYVLATAPDANVALADTYWDFEGGKLTILSAAVNGIIKKACDATFTVTFDNNKTVTFTISPTA